MSNNKTVAVYLGSRKGKGPEFVNNAYRLGQLLAQNDIQIVYGGASVGTMKALADGCAAAGGHITGVFPTGFKGKRDNAAAGIHVGPEGVALSETIFVNDIAERIATMERLSDAMIFLPGSFGTMTEAFSWMEGWQLGYHFKPAFILNTDGYYDGLLTQMRTMIASGFMDGDDTNLLHVADTPDSLVNTLTHISM
ncbi:MAG: TIGR00730 family Rossman fold protein [Bacteroidales bacterium]|nr:TIGR00730 family Rossman fold protein [Bacteroidales bacterium]